MILQFLCDLALGIFDLILGLMPAIDLSGLDAAIEYFFDILSSVCYFLPMGTVGAISSIIYSLFIFRIVISTLKTIWGIIPVL